MAPFPPALRTPPERSHRLGLGLGLLLPLLGSSLMGCQPNPPQDSQQVQRLELRLQQLEQRLNTLQNTPPVKPSARVPVGPIQSITFRTGTADDRLRIYWENGTRSDLPCTKEQATWVCG
ncbi:MAG: hypothetical protein ACKOCM_10095 [Cyanobacteriota bacterium]